MLPREKQRYCESSAIEKLLKQRYNASGGKQRNREAVEAAQSRSC